MVELGGHCAQVYEVSLWICHFSERVVDGLRPWPLIAGYCVSPPQQSLSIEMLILTKSAQLSHLPVLSVEEGVSEHEFLALEELILVRNLGPLGCLGTNSSFLESCFVLRQLLDECGSDFKFWPS